jgi:hypothetical protein
MEERRRQEQLTQDREKLDSSMADLDNMIKFLSSSRPDIVSNIYHLKKSHAELMKELGQCWAYTPGTHTRKDDDGLILEFPCNPTRTRSV